MATIQISFSVASLKTVKKIDELMKYHFLQFAQYEWYILNLVTINTITLAEILKILRFFKNKKSRLTGHPAGFFRFLLDKKNRGYSIEGIIETYNEYVKNSTP